MPNGSFSAQALLAKVLFSDTFTRTHASSWGPDWVLTGTSSGAVVSVDGSAGRLSADDWLYIDDDPKVLPWDQLVAGYVQFDLHVQADLADNDQFFYILQGGPQPFWLEVGLWNTNQYYASIYAFYGAGSANATWVFTPTASTWYRFKFTWAGYPEGLTGVKAWEVGNPEPDTFQGVGNHPDFTAYLSNPDDWFDVQVGFDSPFAEEGRFDNFIIASFGEPENLVVRATFTANAAIRRTGMPGSYVLDAVISPLHFKADAWIIGGRVRHHRQHDHYGTIPDTSVVIASPIGQYPTGTDVHTILASLYARIAALQNNTLKTRSFTLDAWFQPHIKAYAVIHKVVATTIPANAEIINRSVGTVTLDAFLFALRSTSLTADAFLIDSAFGTWTWEYPQPNPADGTTTVFTISPYQQGTVQVYVDGVALIPGMDYAETDDNTGTITFTSPPTLGSIVSVHFIACG